MLIDWFTVAAQAVNFLILAWLLKRFLYGPVIKAMQARRERLAGELEHARQAQEKADSEAEELSLQKKELEREAGAMLGKARQEADTRREQWLAEARAEIEKHSQSWMEELQREQAGLTDRLRTRMADQVVHLAEKVLRDLAGEKLEALVLDDFISRLARTSPDAPIRGQIAIRTGFVLETDSMDRLEQNLRNLFPHCTEIETQQDDSLGFGIVMISDGTKWEWNLASYLDDVEKAVFAELGQAKAET